jgi:hypothetical protein
MYRATAVPVQSVPSSCSEILEVSRVVRQLVWWALHPIGLDLIPAFEAVLREGIDI